MGALKGRVIVYKRDWKVRTERGKIRHWWDAAPTADQPNWAEYRRCMKLSVALSSQRTRGPEGTWTRKACSTGGNTPEKIECVSLITLMVLCWDLWLKKREREKESPLNSESNKRANAFAYLKQSWLPPFLANSSIWPCAPKLLFYLITCCVHSCGPTRSRVRRIIPKALFWDTEVTHHQMKW